MPNRIFGLDSTRVLLAAQSCVAILVGYGLALRYNWNASDVVTTIIVLQTASLGNTLSKASLRMAGTLAGACIGLTIVGSFAHDRELFVLAMALLTGACVWEMQTSIHQYAWMLVVVTSAVVCWPSAMNPLNTFQTSVDRVTAVTIGVILSGLSHALFWPITAAAKFERTMLELLEGSHGLLLMVRHGLREQSMDLEALQKSQGKILALSTSLDATLQAARAESKRYRKHYTQYEQLCDQLEELFLATAAICDASARCIQEPETAETFRSPSLHLAIETIHKECEAAIEQLSLPRDGTSIPADTEDIALRGTTTDSKSLGNPEFEGTSATSLLKERMIALDVVVRRVQASLAEVEASRVNVPSEKSAKAAGPAARARLGKSALASLQVVLGARFFIALDWPLGLQAAMIPMMILAYMNAQLPVALVARTILKSVAASLPLAAVFHFLLMPQVDSLTELLPWLAVLFFPFLYGIASRNPLTSMAAVVSVIMVKSLISISTTPPSYEFSSFANTYLGMGGGFSVVLLLGYLFETRSPRRGFHKLLSVVLSQSADSLKELGNRSLLSSERVSLSKRHRKQSLHGLGKLKKLSATVDYRQDPHASRDQLGSVLRSFEVLVMRLTWGDSLSTSWESYAEHEKRAVMQTHQWCVESLLATGQALAALQPVAKQRPPSDIHESLETAVVTTGQSNDLSPARADAEQRLSAIAAYYLSLTDAIQDCQSKLESVNWKRWCRNYF